MKRLGLWFGVGGIVFGMTGCATPRLATLDPVIRNYADSARVAYERGMPARADELYALALERAKLVNAPNEVARNAYNLALCRMAEGRPVEARALLRPARLTLGHTGAELAQTYGADAEAARPEGRVAEATALAGKALACGPGPDGKVQAHLVLAEMAAETNDLETAVIHYRKADRKVSGSTPALLHARLEGLAARLIRGGMMEGDAALRLESRARWFKAAGQYRQMALSLRDAGDAFAVSERPEQAFDCFVRATQSLSAAGENELARETAKRANEVAERLTDADYAGRATILLEGVRK